MSSESAAKKDTQKLQRAIVDGLEDVKAQNIQVFDTEDLSPLFERVIVASGTSNRQTKALAASVRDAVREAGFAKPRTEGEENGEWIIVDCGAAVAHIMQPAIRQYYHLEDIWGEKPVRLKLGSAKPAKPTKVSKHITTSSSAEPAAADAAPRAPRKAPARAKSAPTKRAGPAAAKKVAKKTVGGKRAVAGRKRVPEKAPAGPVQMVVGKPAAGKKAPARKTVARKTPARKSAASGR